MSSPAEFVPRPLRAVAELDAMVQEMAELPLWPLTDVDKLEYFKQLDQVQRRMDSLRLSGLIEVDTCKATSTVEARTTQAWLRDRLQISPKRSKGDLLLARALESRYRLIGAALAEGRMNVEQARVLVRGLDGLPSRIPGDVRDEAEATLVTHAERFDAGALGKLVKRLRYALDPDGDADRSKDEDRDRAAMWFTLSDDYDGGATLSGWVDDVTKDLIRRVMSSLTDPARTDGADGSGAGLGLGGDGLGGDSTLVAPAQRRGQALAEVFRRVAGLGDLPTENGVRPHVSVTMTLPGLQGLVDQCGTFLDDGTPLSAATARKIACDAGVIPILLGTHGEVLDLGRTARLFTAAQKRALAQRDGGCVHPGCWKPVAWTEAHHMWHWADGGPTDLTNGALGCDHHHDIWHRHGWQLRLGADGHPELLAPGDTTWQPGWRRRPDGTHGPPDP